MGIRILKILAVDDNPDNLISLKALINEAFPDAVVFTAIGGKKGLKLAVDEDPDVILLDIVMPEMDGFEVCRKLKADNRLCDIPVVFVTALKGDKESRIKALECGGEAFLAKPVDESELTAQIRAMVKIKTASTDKRDENERLKRLVEERTASLQKELKEREKAEESVRISEERLRLISDSSADIICSYDLQSRFTSVNRTFCEAMQLTEKDIIGKSHEDLHFPVAQCREWADLHRQVLETGHTLFAESMTPMPNGTEHFYELAIYPLHDNSSAVVGIGVVTRDITERKRASGLLEESYRFNNSLLQTIPFGIDIVDEDGNILYQNEHFENVFGKDKLGCKCWDLYRDDKKQCDECPLHKGIEIGKTDSYESSEVMGGMVFEISHTGMMYKGKKAMLEIFMDITDQKRSELELKESQQLFQGLFNASPDAIVVIDPNHPDISWPIVNCNEASCRMNGYTRDEMIGKSVDFLNKVKGDSKERADYIKKLRQKSIVHVETEHRHKDGHSFPVEVLTSIITIGEREFVLGIDRDITERKKAEAELQKSYDLLNKLAEQVPGVVYQYRLYPDGSSAFPYSSPGMNDIYEVEPEEVREDASLVFTRIHPDDYHSIVESITESARNNTLYHSEFRVILPRQGLRWRLCDAKPERMADGSTLWHGIITDITERKNAEAELHELNNRFSELVASTDGVVWEADAESFTFSFVSKNVERILGYKTEEWLQPNFWANHIYTDDRENTVQFCVDQTNYCLDHDFEYRFVASDGRVIWLADFVKVVIKEGKPSKLHGLMVDLTERKQAELALQKSDVRYKSFISQVTEGVYRFECDEPMDVNLPLEEQIDFIYDHFFIAECNDAIVKMYKLRDQSEFIGMSHLDFHGRRDNPVNRELIREFIRKGYSIENGITEEFDSTGQMRYISNNSIGIIENGYLVRLWGTETDLTEKIRADQVQQVLYAISNAALSSIDLTELIEFISDQLGKLLDSSNFYIAFYDENTGMLSTHYERDEKDSINSWPAEKSITGYVIRHQKSLLASEAEMKRLCEAGETELLGTASKIWLGVPLSVNNKVIGAIVVQSYDNPNAFTEKDQLMLEFVSHQVSISIERKMAEEELKHALGRAQESDRLKSAFLANMSHEIRTPLNSIIGFSDLLLDPEFDSDQQAEFAGMISASGNGLLAIINDLMDISKIEAGQVKLQKSIFSVHKLIGDIQKEYSFIAGEKGIELRLDSLNLPNELFIENDENRLKQILINFVGNAIKFTEKGFVEIGLMTGDHTLQIQVKDSGIGIPKEFHHQIFERFIQVEAANKRKYGGNGLGLAISKSLAELLGGKIGMESEQGKGSVFYVKLPLK